MNIPQVLYLCAGLALVIITGTARADGMNALREKQWIHGSADCETNTDPALEVFRYSASTFILRQNKCDSFEAPFMYLLLGEGRALLLDTGASTHEQDNTLSKQVQDLIGPRQLLVVHSHSHSDHRAGDSQFSGLAQTTVVAPDAAAVKHFFSFEQWPEGEASIELVGRQLVVIPTPGHQEEAIAIYDPHTRWLLTGDTLYPGYIYVKDWDDYRASIARLLAATENYPVDAIMGAHIEMTVRDGEYYPIGTQFQPEEAPLPLAPELLQRLDASLAEAAGPRDIMLDEIIVAPMNSLQRTLSNIGRWLSQ